MKKIIVDVHLLAYDYPPLVKLMDMDNIVHIGYLIRNPYDSRGYVILPLDPNEPKCWFKAYYIKEIRAFENDYKWK